MRPLHQALAEGRARALTSEQEAISLDGTWWVAREIVTSPSM